MGSIGLCWARFDLATVSASMVSSTLGADDLEGRVRSGDESGEEEEGDEASV